MVDVASVGIAPFGRTNSLVPPSVRSPPIKPGFVLKTGDARPVSGVGNRIIVNVSDAGIVRRCDICAGVNLAISSAAVTNTSALPGGPSVGNFIRPRIPT